jgi:hypothetical protein
VYIFKLKREKKPSGSYFPEKKQKSKVNKKKKFEELILHFPRRNNVNQKKKRLLDLLFE